jgi:nitroreductase
MNTLQAISARRSIRCFTGETVAPDVITTCLEAARQAPSSTNSQPWKLVVVRTPERRAGLAAAAYAQRHVAEAGVLFAVLGDRKAFRRRFRRARELQQVGAIGPMSQELTTGYEAFERAMNPDVAITANCMLAAQNLVLAATDMGLGTCWVMLFDTEQVSQVLQLPKTLFPVALIAAGYPAEQPAPRPRYALNEIACDETLDRPWGG